MGMNYAAIMSLLVGFSVIILYVGAVAVTIPVAMIAWFQWGAGSDFLYLMGAYLVVQFMDGNILVPLLFSEGVGKGRIDIRRFVELTSANPARIYGLYPRKGTIAVGADADIAIWDPDKEVEITNDILHHNVDYTPYEGMQVRDIGRRFLLHQYQYRTCNRDPRTMVQTTRA